MILNPNTAKKLEMREDGAELVLLERVQGFTSFIGALQSVIRETKEKKEGELMASSRT